MSSQQSSDNSQNSTSSAQAALDGESADRRKIEELRKSGKFNVRAWTGFVQSSFETGANSLEEALANLPFLRSHANWSITFQSEQAPAELRKSLFDFSPNPNGCSCWTCNPESPNMIVCSTCGNKRCPKATNHALNCTNSNEPGQNGSRF